MSNGALVSTMPSQEIANMDSQRVTIREQIARITPTIACDTDWRQLPRLKINDVDYVANAWLNRWNESPILQYGDYITSIFTYTNNKGQKVEELGEKLWVCHLCDKHGRIKTFNGKSTSAAMKHLTTTTKTGHSMKLENSRQSSPTVSSRANPASLTIRERLLVQGTKEAAVQATYKEFEKLMINFVATCDVSSSSCTSTLFQSLMSSLNPGLAQTMLPTSAATIDTWINRFFDKAHRAIRAQLKSARSKIHLSFDTWSSPNIVVIVAHFIDDQFKLRARLLSLRRIEGMHSESVCYHLDNAIAEYGIKDKLGFYTLDSRGINDNALRSLLKINHNTLGEESIDSLVKQSHIPCMGHVINIIAGRFLYTESEGEETQSIAIPAVQKFRYLSTCMTWTPQRRTAFRQEVSKSRVQTDLPATDKDVDKFLGDPEDNSDDGSDDLGPGPGLLGASKRIWDLEKDLAEYPRVSMDALGNRIVPWNDIVDAITTALPLKAPINNFVDILRKEPSSSERIPFSSLSEEEWFCLEEVRKILEPFENASAAFPGGNTADLPNVLPYLHDLEVHLKKYLKRYGISIGKQSVDHESEDYSDTHSESRLKRKAMSTPTTNNTSGNNKRVKFNKEDELERVDKSQLSEEGQQQIRDALMRSHSTLRSYRRVVRENLAYWAALAFYPCRRLKGLRRLDSQLALEVELFLDDYWEENYLDPAPPPSDKVAAGTRPEDAPQPRKKRGRRARKHWTTIFDDPALSDDELERYLHMDRTNFKQGDDPIEWWKSRQEEFPRLHKFALDFLSIPATTAECEKVFDEAKLTVPHNRQCLKHWLLDDSDELWRLIEGMGNDWEDNDSVVIIDE